MINHCYPTYYYEYFVKETMYLIKIVFLPAKLNLNNYNIFRITKPDIQSNRFDRYRGNVQRWLHFSEVTEFIVCVAR